MSCSTLALPQKVMTQTEWCILQSVRKFFLTSLAITLLAGSNFAVAQSVPSSAGGTGVQAIITGPKDIAVGRTIILDASSSKVDGERTEYRWTIDETKQNIGRNVEAVYTPEKPGKLTFRLQVRSTGLDGKVTQSEATYEVIAYVRKIAVIADSSVSPDKLALHTSEALKEGVYIKVFQTEPDTPPLMTEDALFGRLTEEPESLAGADTIVLWTDGIAGLQALMRAVEQSSNKDSTKQQSLVIITERSLATVSRTARGALTLLEPSQIVVTRKEAINPLIAAHTTDEFKTALESRDIDFAAMDAASVSIRPWDVLSLLVNYLLSHGVSGQAVILLLILPIIATIFAFLRQVIGISTFGLYTPSIVALSFLALGWKIGVLFLLFIVITGYMTRSFMKKWRLLYIPKVAIILTVVSFTLLVLVAFGTWAGLSFSRDTVFILLILSALAENFLSVKTGEGWRAAILTISETVIGSIICVFIVQSQWLQSIILAYPELILSTILINVFLGKWTGLRLVEYFRFREVFKHLQKEE